MRKNKKDEYNNSRTGSGCGKDKIMAREMVTILNDKERDELLWKIAEEGVNMTDEELAAAIEENRRNGITADYEKHPGHNIDLLDYMDPAGNLPDFIEDGRVCKMTDEEILQELKKYPKYE